MWCMHNVTKQNWKIRYNKLGFIKFNTKSTGSHLIEFYLQKIQTGFYIYLLAIIFAIIENK